MQRFGGVLSANAFSSFASFLTTVYAARAFGPAEFGKLALAISITLLVERLIDFGSSTALVRFYNVATSPDESAGFVKALLGFKLFSLLALVPLAFLLQRTTIEILPALSGYGGLVYLAFINGGLLSTWTMLRSVEQARQDFRSFSRHTFVYGILKLLSLGILLVFYEASPISVLCSLFTVPLAGLLLYSWFSRYRLFWQTTTASAYRSNHYGRLKALFSYGSWVAISAVAWVIMERVPQFALARAAAPEEVGLYSAGLTFLSVFLLVQDALRTVILSDVVLLRTSSDRLRFRRRVLWLGPAYFGAGLSGVGFTAFVMYYLLGEAYVPSVPIFVIMGLALILTMYLGTFNTLVHSHGVPRLLAANDVARVVALILLLLLMPKTALNVSLALAGVYVAGELVVFIIVRHMDLRPNTGDPE